MEVKLVSILIHRDDLLKDLTKGIKLRKIYRKRAQKDINIRNDEINSFNSDQRQICIILVDGAWKKHKHQTPRAGVGWSATINNIKIFEGNAKLMAATPLQTEAHTMYQGLTEAFNRGFRIVQIRSDCTELVSAIDSQHQPFNLRTSPRYSITT